MLNNINKKNQKKIKKSFADKKNLLIFALAMKNKRRF